MKEHSLGPYDHTTFHLAGRVVASRGTGQGSLRTSSRLRSRRGHESWNQSRSGIAGNGWLEVAKCLGEDRNGKGEGFRYQAGASNLTGRRAWDCL